MQIFQIELGKQTFEFVSGLAWQPLESASFRTELTTLATEMDMDFYVHRKTDKPQIGLAKSSFGAKIEQIPVALMVAEKLANESAKLNSLVAIQVPGQSNLYFYITISAGYVLADGDRTGTEDEVVSFIREDRSMGGWDQVICPDHWAISDTTARTFDSFIPQKNGKPFFSTSLKLKTVKTAWAGKVILFALLLAVIFAANYGYKAWVRSNAEKQEAILEAQRALDFEKERLSRVIPDPWKSQINPVVFAAACESAFQRTGLVAVNWVFVNFFCDQQSLTIKWERSKTGALISQLKQIWPAAIISPDGGTARITVPLGIPGVVANESEKAPGIEARREYLFDLQNQYGIVIKMTPAPEPQPLAPGQVPTPPATWRAHGVNATTTLRPESATRILAGPAFRLDTITATLDVGVLKYQLNGTQYAKP